MNRIEVIQKILSKTGGKTYLEIGVANGRSFLTVKSETKIGVDPKPPNGAIQGAVDDKATRYFKMTSDKFFNDHRDVLEEHGIDVALVDGLHEYKQALKDVENCVEFLNDNGVIVMHDCSPPSEAGATPPNWLLRHLHVFRDATAWLRAPRSNVAASEKETVVTHDSGPPSRTGATHSKWFFRPLQRLAGQSGREACWNGDVWKTIAHLRSYRDDLDIFVLDCDFGLGIITKGKPASKCNYSARAIRRMSYRDLDTNREDILNLRPPEYLSEFLDTLVAHE